MSFFKSFMARRRRTYRGASSRFASIRSWVRRHRWLSLVLSLTLLYVILLPSGRSYRNSIPAETSMMRIRMAEAAERGRNFRIERRWVSYNKISKDALRAVLAGEDSRFFSHYGIEFGEALKALWEGVRRVEFPRGASTITQQLAKNLYLSESKNPVRKLSEAIIALKMELFLSKRRILELYINSIEWGDGIFGIEAASRYYFGISAAQLSSEQASLLAAMIPNPRTIYNLKRNPRRVQARALRIRAEMKSIAISAF